MAQILPECKIQTTKPVNMRLTGFVLVRGSLVLTYFRERKLTIIGAVLFHGPVRDGKGWGQDAMGTRLKLV
ncbi:hypothetical protein MASR1M60_19190 [Rhodocyclaceae bacterium]